MEQVAGAVADDPDEYGPLPAAEVEMDNDWRRDTRKGIKRILAETRRQIREARMSLEAEEGMS